MNKEQLNRYLSTYENQLFSSCLPFWTDHMMDRQYGGIFSSLDREGNVYSTDKSVWVQGRCLWVYSHLMNVYGVRDDWMNVAKSCKGFLDTYCIDTDGRMFFNVTADGRPLRKRRYFFSETFYIMGNAEYSLATGDTFALNNARKVYDMVMRIYHDPSQDPYKITPKSFASTRATKAFADPMILLNVTAIMRRCDKDNTELYNKLSAELCDTILRDFYKEDLKAVLEHVSLDGEFLSESNETRVVNPGHSIEASWFLMEEAERTGDKELLQRALNIFNWSIERGWDKKYGGIYYFMDVLNKPVVALEADMKLWWPHTEAMIASLMAYKLTGENKYLQWFKVVTDYSLSHFADMECGDWYGYLHRDGSVSHTYKGSLFKGPFHLPRALIQCHQMLKELCAE